MTDMPRISFLTNADTAFCSDDGFGDVPIDDLEIFLQQGRKAIISLEGELMKRRPGRLSDQPGDLGKCCKRLHDTARELCIKQRLDGTAAKYVNDAVEILYDMQPSPSSKTYQTLLYDILHVCGTSLALLCAASLGRKRVVDLGRKDRLNLLAYIGETKTSLESPILKMLADEYSMPASNSLQLIHINEQPRKRAKRFEGSNHCIEQYNGQDSPTRFLDGVDEGNGQMIHGVPSHLGAIDNSLRSMMQRRERQCDEQQRPHLPDSDALYCSPHEQETPASLAPSKEHREMKQIYTNAPISSISDLPDIFKAAIYRSRLWSFERKEGLETTGCLATLFPKDNAQDVSFTIWCGNNDGYHLSNHFGLHHAISS